MDALDSLGAKSARCEVEHVKTMCMGIIKDNLTLLERSSDDNCIAILFDISEVLRKVWQVPVHGYDIGTAICNFLRRKKWLKILIRRFMNHQNEEIQLKWATILEQCLTADNCIYIVKQALLSEVLAGAVKLSTKNDIPSLKTGIDIIAHLTKCTKQVYTETNAPQALKSVLKALKSNDVHILRYGAMAMANYSMFGTKEQLDCFLNEKGIDLLYNLTSPKTNFIVKYYAFLSIAFIAENNDEAKATIRKLDILESVKPYLEGRPTIAIRHELESKEWLIKLVSLLKSRNEDAQMLSAYYFMLEARIQKERQNTELFWEINAVQPLFELKSSSNYAYEALQLMSEDVTKWTPKDVSAWICHIQFAQFERKFKTQVPGPLLLNFIKEKEEGKRNLMDIGMSGLLISNFMIKLESLKKKHDLYVAIHTSSPKPLRRKKFDVFISYRRVHHGLANLMKESLEKKKLSVFIDQEDLKGGEFDKNILKCIQRTEYFLLLLTPGALDKCIGDENCNDWVHKEIATALKSGRKIIPVTDQFKWPKRGILPKDMQNICNYNAVKWDSAYVNSSVERILEFMKNYETEAIAAKSVEKEFANDDKIAPILESPEQTDNASDEKRNGFFSHFCSFI